MKKILIVLDGAADLPHNFLDGKTPFEAANTPNLDYLTKNGKLGYMYPIDENTIPGSDNSLISIFGNNPKECKRGIYEAIGAGAKIKRGDLALRTNFASIKDLGSKEIVDRRCGRTLTTKEAKTLANEINKKVKLSCKFEFISTIQHRGVLILRGGFSDNITNTDPEWNHSKQNNFKFATPLDEELNTKHTANTLNNFLTQTFNLLNNHPINQIRRKKGLPPANMLLTRGGGTEIPKIKKYSTWMSINAMPLELGISKLSNMKTFSFEYPKLKGIDAYKNLHKGLNKIIKFSIKTIKKQHKNYLGCYIQFKETDLPGHDNKPHEKQKILETLDKKFFSFIKKFAIKNNIKVVVTCDHSTPCKLKKHSNNPVPVLVYDNKNTDNTTHFTEKQSKIGSLGKFFGKDFMAKTGLIK